MVVVFQTEIRHCHHPVSLADFCLEKWWWQRRVKKAKTTTTIYFGWTGMSPGSLKSPQNHSEKDAK